MLPARQLLDFIDDISKRSLASTRGGFHAMEMA